MAAAVACLLKTHMWNPQVARAHAMLSAAWGGPVALLADETSGPLATPSGLAKIPYSAAAFAAMGLPIYPDRAKGLWFNCDYPLYVVFDHIDADAAAIVEYDLVCPHDLRARVEAMAASTSDFVVHRHRPVPAGVFWEQNALAWYARHPLPPGIEMHECLPPFTFIRREAAAELGRSRIADARGWRRRATLAKLFLRPRPVWLFSEMFLGTEPLVRGLSVGHLEAFGDCQRLVYAQPTHWDDIPERPERFYHPVLSGNAFVERLMKHVEVVDDWTPQGLAAMRARCRGADEAALFDRRIEGELARRQPA